jgi:predicted dithiol-disulfide oxidoreductase (DUF899 family)
MTTPKIEYPKVVLRAEWLEARKRLLEQEKELTHARGRLNSQLRNGRGTEGVGGSYYLLDFTVLGRQEPWEEPKGRQTGLGAAAGSEKIRYPDEGEQPDRSSCCD